MIGLLHIVINASDASDAIDIKPYLLLEAGSVALNAIAVLDKPRQA